MDALRYYLANSYRTYYHPAMPKKLSQKLRGLETGKSMTILHAAPYRCFVGNRNRLKRMDGISFKEESSGKSVIITRVK